MHGPSNAHPLAAIPAKPVAVCPGIPEPDRPGSWLVPPWERGMNFADTVSHFLLWTPRDPQNTRRMLAYYQSYQAALESSSTDLLTLTGDKEWHRIMLNCIDRCVTSYREQRSTEAHGRRGSTTVDVRRLTGIQGRAS